MTTTEATQWVRDHNDEDELDEAELREAFYAIFERAFDAQDEREGLWSHLCAAVASEVTQ